MITTREKIIDRFTKTYWKMQINQNRIRTYLIIIIINKVRTIIPKPDKKQLNTPTKIHSKVILVPQKILKKTSNF